MLWSIQYNIQYNDGGEQLCSLYSIALKRNFMAKLSSFKLILYYTQNNIYKEQYQNFVCMFNMWQILYGSKTLKKVAVLLIETCDSSFGGEHYYVFNQYMKNKRMFH